MRIAQVAPLDESVPPSSYGGTERVVAWLTDALAGRGHDVTLFASGDSKTSARLVPGCPRSLRADGGRLPVASHLRMLEMVARHAADFDIVHFHCDLVHFPLARRMAKPQLTTLHGRLDLPELVALYREYAELPLVSISDAQRRPVRHGRWLGTVHHGLPPDLYTPRLDSESYFAFVGRISPEKRIDRAIRIARETGIPLRIGAKIDRVDREYFEQKIAPLMRDPLVEYLGEIDDQEKAEVVGGARALLFPIDWPEPFGLVMIEAMACGTPVIAFEHGSVPEVLEDGVTGFIVQDLDGAIAAAARAHEIDRRRCRETFERRFSVDRMATDYLGLYERLAAAPAAASGQLP